MLLVCLVYFGFAFAHWDANPGRWGASSRGFVGAIVFAITVGCIITIDFSEIVDHE